MSLLDSAREALKELPISDLVRERLSLALDRLSEAEAKIEVLQAENARLRVELENERLNHQHTRDQLQRLQEEHAEEVLIARGIEFRRGKRTRSRWEPFCPACHIPADLSCGTARCGRDACGWQTMISGPSVQHIISGLPL
jgi:hypothetical protein